MTKRTVTLTPGIARDLQTLISRLPTQLPEEFVPVEAGAHRGHDNVWRRSMQLSLATVGLECAIFLVLRRTNAGSLETED